MAKAGPESEERFLLREMLRATTRSASRHPKSTLLVVFLLAAASIAWTCHSLQFKTNRADLIDPTARYHQRWRTYTESFGDGSDMIVVVEADDPEAIKQVLDDLGTRIEKEPELFSNVLYKVEPGALLGKGLQYLSPQQLEAGLNHLDEFLPVSQGRWDLIRVDSLYVRLNSQVSRIQPEYLKTHRELIEERSEPLLKQIKLLSVSLTRFLEDRNDFVSPWLEILPVDRTMREEARQVTYLLNDSGTMGFLKATPTSPHDGMYGASQSIDRLRDIIATVSLNWPHARIGLTGIPVLENDEMRKSNADMMVASVISFVGVGLLLFFGFRGFRHPFLALLMLAVGLAWSFGFTTLTVGHLNILSISFAAILIGLGIDFAIHYLARYLELRHQGYMLRPALLETSAGVGTGIVTAALTTAFAFFSAIFSSFLGVAELGVIAGGGILLCAIATFVVLPALVAIADEHVEPRRLPTQFQGNLLRLLVSRHPWAFTIGTAAFIAIIGSQAVKFENGRPKFAVGYDFNLLNLQADGLESVDVQKRIVRESGGSLLFAVSLADSAEEARSLRQRFERLPTVGRVEELGSRLPAWPAQETQLLVQGYQAQLARIPKSLPDLGTIDPASLGQSMEKLLGRLVQLRLLPAAEEASRAIDAFLNEFERLTLDQQLAYLNEYQVHMTAALLEQFQALRMASNPEPVTLSDLPPELTSRFVGSSGKWLVQIYPKEPIWDIEPLRDFVDDVRSIDPEVTGTPLQNFEASQDITNSYQNAAIYALAIISVVLLIDFLGQDHGLWSVLPSLAIVAAIAGYQHYCREPLDYIFLSATGVAVMIAIATLLDFGSVRNTIFALLPPVAGSAIMFGVLAMLGISLNPANLIVLPLVLGIGVDDGVHVIHDFRTQSERARYRMSPSTINAIVLTSLTSMIGFGSMTIAAHRGLYSLGLVLVVGVGSCLFVSVVLLPAILTIVFKGSIRPHRPRRLPTPYRQLEPGARETHATSLSVDSVAS